MALKLGASEVPSDATQSPHDEKRHKRKKKKKSGDRDKERTRVDEWKNEDEDMSVSQEEEEDMYEPPTKKRVADLDEESNSSQDVLPPRTTRLARESKGDEKVILRKVLLYIQEKLQSKDINDFFAYPVNDVIAPGYSAIITEPMDFSAMLSKIENDHYDSILDYKEDYVQMCNNAMTYNRPETIYYKEAKRLLQSGIKMMSKEKLMSMKRSLSFMCSITLEELGVNKQDSTGAVIEAIHAKEKEYEKTMKNRDNIGRYEALPDNMTSDEIIAQAKAATKEAADMLTLREPRTQLSFLRRREDGSTSITVLNTDNDGIAYKAELVTVKEELASIEVELDDLLLRQSSLLERKNELERLLTQNASKSTSVQDKAWDKTDFKWSDELQAKLQSVFKIKKLRPMQLQTMNVTMSGKDCILIMPTGGGKSLCFQLPALLCKGITLVVSPLVSLMEDQVMALRGFDVDANMLNAATDKMELKQVQQAMVDCNAQLKLLYVTPEKLAKSKRFMAQLEKMYKMGRFSRLVIDEVHCCSQWGHDFRPDYKFLGIMKRQFPDVPILGLTATATSNVLEDVKKILNLSNCHLFRASFNRPNLYYEVREKPSSHKEVMDNIQKLVNTKFHQQSGIIYTFSKKESEDVAADLQSRGIKAGCYHADMTAQQRSRIHVAWIDNRIHVVVATVAFGMGIDKPDVRYVIHHSLSKSMENLYQESGRAGRDDKKSHCIVYYRFQDIFRQSAMVMAEQTGLKNLYGIMEYCTDVSKCRRCMIARYFGEVWDSSQCNKMCDHCNSDYEVVKKDVTLYCSNAVKILDNAASTEQRLTAIKLLDAWQGKGPKTSRVKDTETRTERGKLEHILAFMLKRDYIKEDFHFTAYTTVSYLITGSKAGFLRNGKDKVFLEMRGKRRVSSNTAGSTSTVSQDGNVSQKDSTSLVKLGTSKMDDPKPKLVNVNEHKSAFTNMVKKGGEDPESGKGSKQLVRLRMNDTKRLKKRKVPVIDTNSDDEGLEYGSDEGIHRSKKLKLIKGSSISSNSQGSHDSISTHRSSCVNGRDKITEKGNTTIKPVIIETDDDSESDMINPVIDKPSMSYSFSNDDNIFIL